MSLFDIMTEVENQEVEIELALAVLDEISDYFVLESDHPSLPHYAEHIYDLLSVVVRLLRNTEPKTKEVVKELMIKIKEETCGKVH